MSKKNRIARSFDFDVVRSRIEEEKGEIIQIRKHFDALKKFDLQRVVSSLSENEIIQLLACRLTFRTIELLRTAMQHVPKKIPRIVDGHSLRNVFIQKVFNSMCCTSMSIEEVAMYVDILESRCPLFVSKEGKTDSVWELSKAENKPYTKFLTPPVTSCICCEKLLSMKNYPASAKLFTTNGPIPCSKTTLKCRSCSCTYGVYSYANERGTHLYSQEIKVDTIEISNVTYIDLNLYKWFPALR